MINNSIETNLNIPEDLSQKELEDKLSEVSEKYDHLLEQAPEFYDQELYDLYIKAAKNSGGDLKVMTLLLNVEDCGYEAALENYTKFENFKNQILEPVKIEARSITQEINKIKSREAEEKRKKIESDENIKFQKEKDVLADSLYEALDSIHSKIPKEATESGMNSTIALKTYLPELAHKTEVLGHYIRRIEEANTPSEISRLKKGLELDGVLDR